MGAEMGARLRRLVHDPSRTEYDAKPDEHALLVHEEHGRCVFATVARKAEVAPVVLSHARSSPGSQGRGRC